jgi:hypothetical protein
VVAEFDNIFAKGRKWHPGGAFFFLRRNFPLAISGGM